MKTIKQDQALMQILKVHEINRIICETNMGVLKLQLLKGQTEYKFLLDSVPLPKELHKEVYELLYAPEIPQVFYNSAPNLTKEQAEKLASMVDDTEVIMPYKSIKPAKEILGIPLTVKKKGGRPKGSVNKK